MAFVVVYDANVLFPASVRDLLLEMAAGGVFRAHFSSQILNEVTESLSFRYPDVAQRDWENLASNMVTAVRGICVECDEALAGDHVLPDPDDQHVLALALQTGAQLIVTENATDFPESVLKPLGIESLNADQFVLNVATLDRRSVTSALEGVSARLKNPPLTAREILVRAGLHLSLAELTSDLT